jgi:hypothetical protein
MRKGDEIWERTSEGGSPRSDMIVEKLTGPMSKRYILRPCAAASLARFAEMARSWRTSTNKVELSSGKRHARALTVASIAHDGGCWIASARNKVASVGRLSL